MCVCGSSALLLFFCVKCSSEVVFHLRLAVASSEMLSHLSAASSALGFFVHPLKKYVLALKRPSKKKKKKPGISLQYSSRHKDVLNYTSELWSAKSSLVSLILELFLLQKTNKQTKNQMEVRGEEGLTDTRDLTGWTRWLSK